MRQASDPYPQRGARVFPHPPELTLHGHRPLKQSTLLSRKKIIVMPPPCPGILRANYSTEAPFPCSSRASLAPAHFLKLWERDMMNTDSGTTLNMCLCLGRSWVSGPRLPSQFWGSIFKVFCLPPSTIGSHFLPPDSGFCVKLFNKRKYNDKGVNTRGYNIR